MQRQLNIRCAPRNLARCYNTRTWSFSLDKHKEAHVYNLIIEAFLNRKTPIYVILQMFPHVRVANYLFKV